MISKAPWTPSSSHILGWNLQYRIYLSPCIWTHDLGMVIKLPVSFLTWHTVCQHHGHRWFGYVSMSIYELCPHDTRGESQRFTTKPRMVEWIWPLGATWNRWILPPQRMYPDVLKVASQWYRGKNTYELPHLPSVQHPCARTNYTRFSVGNFVLHGL